MGRHYREAIPAMETIQTVNLPEFTQRELDVVYLIAHLYTRQQTADKLGISYRTVDTYMHSIFKKIGIHRQVDLIAFAQVNGLQKNTEVQ
jgi:DNA-binding CsgD family transcriptional regulator